MARIGIDATVVVPDGKGISRVVRESALALAQLPLPHDLVVLVRGTGAEAAFRGSGLRCRRVGGRRALVWEQFALPVVARRERLDAVLTTSDRLPVAPGTRCLLWLFENPEHRIEENIRRKAGAYQHTSDVVTRALWRRSVRRAAAVVAGSHATAREIADVAGLAAEPAVVHPGLGPEYTPGPARDRGHYVLHLASADPRDNTATALAAFASARTRLREPVRLVVAGGLGDRRRLVEGELARLGLAGAVDLPGRVADDELIDLYRGAAVYLDPSLFEGFGFQVLEAMGCGAPVAASSVTSIPEIAADAALLCAPTDVEGFADAICRVLDDPALARTMRERGLARAATFTWERTARGLAAALEGVLRGG
jgi:glycosyltransferase involved in cell wall biosynthesis